MAKYTFRFHYHGSVDISVDADNYEDAYMKADDKYCMGDYKEDAEYFENTHVEMIEGKYDD